MKKAIIFACMSLLFSVSLHATAVKKGNKNCKKTTRKAKQKQAANYSEWGCISTLMSGTAGQPGAVYMYMCAGPGPCSPSGADQCWPSPDGQNHATMSMVTVQSPSVN